MTGSVDLGGHDGVERIHVAHGKESAISKPGGVRDGGDRAKTISDRGKGIGQGVFIGNVAGVD